MELLKGEELASVLKKRGTLAPSEALVLLGQAALALDRTHAAGIVHRDLKPENLFVTRRDDGSPRLKVLDFGIAKVRAQSSQSVKTTRSLGTPVYMSPEQVEGDGAIDHRADLYALGHVAYTLLVGEAYWEREARANDAVYPLLVKIMQGAKEPPSARAGARGVALSPGFDAWFAKATALSPHDRFDSADALVEGLATALDTERPPNGVRTEPASGERAEAAGRTKPWPIAAAAAACALVAVGVLGLGGLRAMSAPARAGAHEPPTGLVPLPPAPSAEGPAASVSATLPAPATAKALASAAPSAAPKPRPTGSRLPEGVEREP